MTRSGCDDWCQLSSAEAHALIDAEARAWAAELDWDVVEAWRHLEPARAAGRLPGLAYRDPSGRLTGWCCYLVHQNTLQMAMLVAEHRDVTAALVAAVLESAEAATARSWALCVRQAAPGLKAALAGHGFRVARYRYLSAAPGVAADVPPGVRAWRPTDIAPAARLLARAYTHSSDVRAFAVHDTADEWRDYTEGLVTRPGCGQFVPGASFVLDVPAPAAGGRRANAMLDGAILTTDLGCRTAHVAQIAVDPAARGLGLGRALMTATMTAAAARGFERVTLLVADANHVAARLYETLGFRDRAVFLVGANRQPRRSTRVALAAGGASTRR
jgi:ribosomal protein S18 acetylase RimI-like enzyme